MIRQREVKTNKAQKIPHIPPKSKTPRQKGDGVRRMCVSSTYSVYSVCAVYAKTNEAPHVQSTHVLSPPVYRPGVTKWPLLPSNVFAGLLLVANESSAHIADQC